MEINQFVTHAKRLLPKQTAAITFRADGIVGLSRLIGLTRLYPEVSIAPSDFGTCLAVEMSQDWGHPCNQTVKVIGLANAHNALLEPMARDVEKLSGPEHAAKALFTTNVRAFEEAAARITKQVLAPDLVGEVASWGLDLSSDPQMFLPGNNGLPGIDFTIRIPNHQILFSVILDGWSGRLLVHDTWNNCSYEGPAVIHHVLRANLESCVEKFTAAAT